MTGRDLAAEMAAAGSRVRLAHLERLRALGVSYEALAALGAAQPTIGIARIAATGEGLFEPCEGGDLACLVAVVEQDAEPGDPGISDIVAFSSDNPSRWLWRVGSGFALGADLLRDYGADDAGMHDGIPVVATPVHWLAAAGRATCILDWDLKSPVWTLLRYGPDLTFTDDILRQRVRNGLVATAPMPSLRILKDAA